MQKNSLQKGAYSAVKVCLGVSSNDRVVILGDTQTGEVDQALLDEAKKITPNVLLVNIDEYGKRPLQEFPQKMQENIADFYPTVSIYAASTVQGELEYFRHFLIEFLRDELQCRHGHMIHITKQIMEDGMCADYNEVFKITNKVYDNIKDAKIIRVTSAKGTDVTATFHTNWKWIPCHGRYHKQGEWGNLPEGEVFTCPADVNGVIVAEELGEYFTHKYGILSDSLSIYVKDGYVWDARCKNKSLEEDFKQYIYTAPFCNRVGEFSIGTNTGLKKLIGNFLQDEKFPGVHIAFGHPYPKQTGADWDANRHVDVIPMGVSVWVDGRELMREGKFLL